ncbi:PRP38 family domain-containing protein, putative [Eimeria maxima]|uniref:PRP38 family domain-containing protein, putative n=1 Tax=Eimeria maxima TaxID=5804 RepID=U6M2N7_EIMMA|nr:PRP38 family domain-containing protein, putative [Eimeria maxima]CDJ57338.1 PRP38 family domain-containing protein, putative [Eimeria maxima]
MTLYNHRKRKIFNKKHIHAFIPNAKCIALSSGDWLEGTVLSVDAKGVWVSLEDGNEENIDLGLVQLLSYKTGAAAAGAAAAGTAAGTLTAAAAAAAIDTNAAAAKRSKNRDRDRDRDRDRERDRDRDRDRDRKRSRSRSTDRTTAKTQQQLLQEFRRKEQEKALATGKDYARRPTSYKSALSLKMTSSRHVPSPERPPPVRAHPRSALPQQQQQQQQQQQMQQQDQQKKQHMASLVARNSRQGGDSIDRRRHNDTETPDVLRLG